MQNNHSFKLGGNMPKDIVKTDYFCFNQKSKVYLNELKTSICLLNLVTLYIIISNATVGVVHKLRDTIGFINIQ